MGAKLKFINFVRKQPCLVGMNCFGDVIAHHVRTPINSGMGLKPLDNYCVPLCVKHHADLHNNGKQTFKAKYKIDLIEENEKLLERFKNGFENN